MNLPVTIIGGYLGAGKTTLVNHLLRHADGQRLAVLVNEFGDLPIDQDLIEAQDDNIISIAGGCVCCSYGNDLTLALIDLTKLDPPPDHVLLEASGVALPGSIAASVSLIQGYDLDGVVVLVNAETIRQQAGDPYMGDTIDRQLATADLVILNKTDLVSKTEINALDGWLSEKAPGAKIIPAQRGNVAPQIILQPQFLKGKMPEAAVHHHHHDPFHTISLLVEHRVDADGLAQALAADELGLVRAKGFVRDAKGDMKTIQVVGRRFEITPAPSGVSCGLVAIGPKEAFSQSDVSTLIVKFKL